MEAGADAATVAWRLRTVEGKVDDLDKEKADTEDVKALAEEFRSLRGALVTFALTIGGSAVVFALSTVALLQ